MSFLNIEDTFQREKHIKEYLATVKRIKNRNLHERAQNFANHEMLEESFEPVVHATAASTEAITKELIPIKDQLEQLAKLAKPKAVRVGIKRPAEEDLEQPEQLEVNQPVKPAKQEQFGPLAQDFLKDYMNEEKRQREIDSSFGFRYANGEWKIGDKRVLLNPDDSMFIDGETYAGTPGFWSLVTRKMPKNYTQDDLDRYKELLHETHVLHQDYDKYSRYPRANRSKKWVKILAPIWREFSEHGIVQDEQTEEDSDGYETATETAPEEEEGHGIKMYLQKNGRCFALDKTTDGAIKFQPRPKLAGVNGNGLYLRHGGDIYHGEGLLLGKSSPFRNIPVLGWLL